MGRELTEHERAVLQCVAYGYENVAIASLLARHPDTIKKTRQRIYVKLGATNAPSAVYIGIQRGLISMSEEVSEHGSSSAPMRVQMADNS